TPRQRVLGLARGVFCDLTEHNDLQKEEKRAFRDFGSEGRNQSITFTKCNEACFSLVFWLNLLIFIATFLGWRRDGNGSAFKGRREESRRRATEGRISQGKGEPVGHRDRQSPAPLRASVHD